MKFIVHSQTGDVVRADGHIVTGNSEDGWLDCDLGHGWTVSAFGSNEKQVAVTWELGYGYDVDMSATVGLNLNDQINIAFTGGSTSYRYGVDTVQYSLIARNRVTDENTGLEWND